MPSLLPGFLILCDPEASLPWTCPLLIHLPWGEVTMIIRKLMGTGECSVQLP